MGPPVRRRIEPESLADPSAPPGPSARSPMKARPPAPSGGPPPPRAPPAKNTHAGAGGIPQGFEKVEPDPRPDAPKRCVTRWTVPGDPAGAPPVQLAAALRKVVGEPAPGSRVKPGDVVGDLECVKGGTVLWQDTVESPAIVMAGCSSFCAVATHAGYLHLFSPAGRRLAGAICLGLGVKFLCIDTKHRLLVVTFSGDVIVYVRDEAEPFIGFKCDLRESARALLLSNPPVDIVSATLSLNGTPLLTGAGGDTYALDRAMRAWVQVLDPEVRVTVGTAHLASGVPEQPPASPPRGAASVQPRAVGVGGGSLEGEGEYALERARLESMVGASHLLGHETGLRAWMSKYAHFLARHGDKGRLRELCEECLANVTPAGTSTGAPPKRKRPALDANDLPPPRGEAQDASTEGAGTRIFSDLETGEERRDLPMDLLVRECILPAVISRGADLEGLRQDVESILHRAGR